MNGPRLATAAGGLSRSAEAVTAGAEASATAGAAVLLADPPSQLSLALCQPGPDPALWPPHLQALFLRYLELGDLGRLGLACRRWYDLIHGQGLPQRRFLSAWQPTDLERILQAVRGQSARCRLSGDEAPPRDGPPPDVSPEHLFFAQVQQRMQAASFAPVFQTCVCGDSLHRLSDLVCSPDGQTLAVLSSGCHFKGRSTCTLYSLAEGRLRLVQQFPVREELQHLMFSPDSACLEGLDNTGHWNRWSRAQDGCWQPLDRLSQDIPCVSAVQVSPDGQYLAVVDDGQRWHQGEDWVAIKREQAGVYVLGKTASGWRVQYRWLWPPALPYALVPEATDLQFSNDSRVFVFAAAQRICICQRSSAFWQLQSFDSALARGRSAFLAPDGTSLALYHAPADFPLDPRNPMDPVSLVDRYPADWQRRRERVWFWGQDRDDQDACVTLWLPDPQQHWYKAVQLPCAASSLEEGRLAFSPDSRSLAFADRPHGGQRRLRVWSNRPSGWQLSATLALCQPGVSDESQFHVAHLHFGARGDHLVAMTYAGLHLWRRDGWQQGWVAAGWLTTGPVCRGLKSVDCRFSPDGCHGALVLDEAGQCYVWGLHSSGDYLWRLRVDFPGVELQKPRFTPDGSHLVVAFFNPLTEEDGGKVGLACLSLVPEPREPGCSNPGPLPD